MFKLIVKNIISLLLILTLLPATSGIMIFHHICNTSHTHTVSLFTQSKCDHHEETTGVCEHCFKNLKSCSIENHTSCIEYSQFLSIDADFVASNKQLIKINESDLPVKNLFVIKFQDRTETLIIQQEYFKRDIKKPIENFISILIFHSQSKLVEDASGILV